MYCIVFMTLSIRKFGDFSSQKTQIFAKAFKEDWVLLFSILYHSKFISMNQLFSLISHFSTDMGVPLPYFTPPQSAPLVMFVRSAILIAPFSKVRRDFSLILSRKKLLR